MSFVHMLNLGDVFLRPLSVCFAGRVGRTSLEWANSRYVSAMVSTQDNELHNFQRGRYTTNKNDIQDIRIIFLLFSYDIPMIFGRYIYINISHYRNIIGIFHRNIIGIHDIPMIFL